VRDGIPHELLAAETLVPPADDNDVGAGGKRGLLLGMERERAERAKGRRGALEVVEERGIGVGHAGRCARLARGVNGRRAEAGF
jgi:hypothetical protein